MSDTIEVGMIRDIIQKCAVFANGRFMPKTGFTMNVLFYDPDREFLELGKEPPWREWMKPLDVFFSETVGDVIDHLRSLEKRPQVAILCVNDPYLMSYFLLRKKLFKNISIVLVLPVDETEMLQLAYGLQPRYIDFLENKRGTLLSILRSMTTVA